MTTRTVRIVATKQIDGKALYVSVDEEIDIPEGASAEEIVLARRADVEGELHEFIQRVIDELQPSVSVTVALLPE